ALGDRTLLSVVTWINQAGGDWDTATNWRDDQGVNRVPGPDDQAIIDIPRQNGFTVTHSSSAADSGYSLTSQDAISFTAGSLSFGAASTINNALTVSGGQANFESLPGANLMISNLTIADGSAAGFSATGGPVTVTLSSLTMGGVHGGGLAGTD